MLYDILFIDDDFENQSNSQEWEKNAQKLFLDFVRQNLRVTYTTGELEDLKKLKSKDLSCIQYIFCDLHLIGISGNRSTNKDIASKLLGIFKELAPQIKSEKITVLINSQFRKDWDPRFTENIDDRYKFELIENKNVIPDKNIQELLRQNLETHLKSIIINKAIEVERIFDKKLSIDKKFVDVITFENKNKKFLKKFTFDRKIKRQISLLQQIRNKVAHTDNKFVDITDNGVRKEFWHICLGEEKTDDIEFEDFEQLMKYIESIVKLMNDLQQTQ